MKSISHNNQAVLQSALATFTFGLPIQAKEKPKFSPDRPVSHTVLEQTSLDDMPYVHAQQELEILFDKNQRIKRIKSEFDIDDFHVMCHEANLDVKFCVDLCAQMVIHRRTTASVLIGILHYHFKANNSRQQAMQACAHSLEAAIENDFVDFDTRSDQFIQVLTLTAETIQSIDRYQYPLPMVVEPRATNTNRQNGYLSPTTSTSLVVLHGEKADGLYENADICLDHINRVNRVPLSINQDVVNLIDNEWADLDKRRKGERFEDFQKRLKAFDKYDRCSKDVLHALSGLRDKLWLTHKYDRRGRVYCQGYHVNYQGNPWNKAVIEFFNKEKVSW